MGDGFDRLLVVLIREMNRTRVTERGVELASVVDGIDEPGKIG
jgi:hypothetical protein